MFCPGKNSVFLIQVMTLMKRCVKSLIICCDCPLFYYRMMKKITMSMSIMEMLCMHPVYVGPKGVKDTCSSKLFIVYGVLQYTTYNILIGKSVGPRVASLQSVGPQPYSLLGHL